MKRLLLIATGMLVGTLALSAQQGRGGPPLAWNDSDKDRICDLSGKPVGQRPFLGRERGAIPAAAKDAAEGKPPGQRAFRGRGRGAWGRGAWGGGAWGRGAARNGRGAWVAGNGVRGGRGLARGSRWSQPEAVQEETQTQPDTGKKNQ